jgi:hypothetical protein
MVIYGTLQATRIILSNGTEIEKTRNEKDIDFIERVDLKVKKDYSANLVIS